MEEIEIEKINESYSRICSYGDSDVLFDLQSYFTVEIEGAKFNPKFRQMGWDGRKAFFNARKGVICNGLIPSTKKWCADNGVKLTFSNFPDVPSMDMVEFVEANKEILGKSGYVPRDYQEKAVFEALDKRHGILECCTSSGKSLMIYLIIRHLLRRGLKHVLLCVPNVSLVNQMYSDFKDYGWEDIEDHCETLFAGEEPTFEKPVLISTWQSLQSKETTFFDMFTGVIYDECHSSKAVVVNKILKACENSIWRIGTTGTLPTSRADLLTIASVLGSVLFRITSKELIDRGYLTRMVVAGLFVKYPFEFTKRIRGADYVNEVKEFEECDARQRAIETILRHTKPEHNLLVLVNHIEHLEKVVKYIRDKFPDRTVETIDGKVGAKRREEIRRSAENMEGLVIVATYGTCSTGINIRKLHGIVLYSNSKSKIRVLQSLGRGLRKHDTKDKVVLYDVVDDCRYTKRTGTIFQNRVFEHWLERRKFYEQEGYPITTLEIDVTK